jgi:hypothetical protein
MVSPSFTCARLTIALHNLGSNIDGCKNFLCESLFVQSILGCGILMPIRLVKEAELLLPVLFETITIWQSGFSSSTFAPVFFFRSSTTLLRSSTSLVPKQENVLPLRTE